MQNRFFQSFAAISCATFTVSAAAFAENWTEFRGPTGQGNSTAHGLPAEWSTTKNIAWKQAIPGKGWSSPIIVDGHVYLTTAVTDASGSSQSLRTLCLGAVDGKTLWSTEVFSSSITRAHGKNSQASPTPIVEGRRLYVHFGHMGTACLDLDGKIIWSNNSLGYPPVHGNGGSPALVDDALVFSCDGANDPFIIALSKADGKVLWKTSRETTAAKKFSFSTPLVITVSGQKQIITPGSGAVCALNPKDGSEIWRVRYGEGYSVVPRPVFGHGMIFLSSGFDRASIIAIRPDGKGDVTDTHVVWTLGKSAPKTPSPLLVGDELYIVSDDGVASCVDAKTGSVYWAERLTGGFSSSPLFADGKLYFQNETGTGFVLKAGKTFEKLAENPLGEKSLASYAVADKALFIRTEQTLFKVQAQ
ncbi:MAG: PQQ-like beta-propeller repeat protein [Verrucomicrobia bacterium]|nr:PQQ-like beta-propeller repeat protein [Verrucomicrobiota bacterium]